MTINHGYVSLLIGFAVLLLMAAAVLLWMQTPEMFHHMSHVFCPQ